RRVRTHVGDEADRPVVAEVDALVEILRYAHGALGAERQLLGRLLLKRGRGERRRRILATFATLDVGDAKVFARGEVGDDALRLGLVMDLGLLAVDVMEFGGEALAVLLEQRFDRPVLDRLERADLPLPLHDEPERDGLHAAGRDSLLYGFPKHRARLVADEAVEHAARLLGFDLLGVDRPGIQDGALHRVFRDLVKEHALDRQRAGAALRPDLAGDVRGDRLTLAVRVGGDEHFPAVLRCVLQRGDGFFLAGNRHEVGEKPVVDVDAELLLGKVHDVAHRGAHAVAAPQVLADGLRLGRRLDDDERAARRRAGVGAVFDRRRIDLGATPPPPPTGSRLGRGLFLGRGLGLRRRFLRRHSYFL